MRWTRSRSLTPAGISGACEPHWRSLISFCCTVHLWTNGEGRGGVLPWSSPITMLTHYTHSAGVNGNARGNLCTWLMHEGINSNEFILTYAPEDYATKLSFIQQYGTLSWFSNLFVSDKLIVNVGDTFHLNSVRNSLYFFQTNSDKILWQFFSQWAEVQLILKTGWIEVVLLVAKYTFLTLVTALTVKRYIRMAVIKPELNREGTGNHCCIVGETLPLLLGV